MNGRWLVGGVSLSDATLVVLLGGEEGRCFSDVCNAGFSDASRGDFSCRGVGNTWPDMVWAPVGEAERVCNTRRPVCGSGKPFARKNLAWDPVAGDGDVGIAGEIEVDTLLTLLA